MSAEADKIGVPLRHYIDHHPKVGVRFICQGCCSTRDRPMGEVVAGLKARGLGDETTGIRAIARLLTRPCARCSRVYWETRPAFG